MSFTVQGTPGFYQGEESILDSLELKLQGYGFKKGLVIHGEKSWQAIKPYFPEFKELALTYENYCGECSDLEISRLVDLALKVEAEFILAIGGGKVLDLAKAVASKIQRDVVLIPTLAATCAAWTSLSVIYTEEGVYERYQVFPRHILMVLVEPRIFVSSPVQYLRAGIGDTLAKWYEARALTKGELDLRVPIKIAIETAAICKEVLLEQGAFSLEALEKGELTSSLLSVIETNIIAGGMVGGLGDTYGRIAGAHSVHNGLTRLKETHHLLHGEKVAYGILVQLALEKEFEEIEKLIPFYRQVSLPYSLKHLGISSDDDIAIQTISQGALAPGESIHFMKDKYTEEEVIKAIRAVESFQ